MKAPAKIFVVAGAAGMLLLLGYFQGYLHGMTGGMADLLAADANKVKDENIERLALAAQKIALSGGSKNSFVGQLDIEVKEKPFGMHVRRGSVIVEEVFHGFLAEKLGVREGCELLRIAGQDVKQGTWLEIFQKTATPFKLSLNCPPQSSRGQGPMSTDKHNYRVMVVKRPFGMNIQVNVVPRVVEVLAGSSAEKAGVRPGFVLTHVQEQAVDATNWFDAWQHAALPGLLVFDTDMPLNKSNKFFNHSSNKSFAPASHPDAPAHPNLPDEWHEDEAVPGFDDVRITVKELPFGMHIDAPPGKLPIVAQLTAKSPAEVAGVKAGDVLLKVAGHRIDSSTWYSAFQHAVPPFGLHFRRPHVTVASGKSNLTLPVMPTFGEMTVSVSERPFGMKVRRSSREVQTVFDGFPAQKVGVRKGCQILEIAGQGFKEGTWMELFQKTALPFNLKLLCAKAAKDSKAAAAAALSRDEHKFEVVVKERPFGMNIQAHTVPRVVEALPGSPAEAAGIKAGFVLTAINGQHVDSHTWFDIWTDMPPGAVLTFDTNMPMQADNPFFPSDNKSGQATDQKLPPPLLFTGSEGYSDFSAAVRKLPFGMQLRAPQDGQPTVSKITKGSPAEEAGIKVGDVLMQIAGLPVVTSDWFKAFQQAVPPFGLHFRRPDDRANTNSETPKIDPPHADEKVHLQIMKRPEETTNKEAIPEGNANISSESSPEEKANTQNNTRPEEKANIFNETMPGSEARASIQNETTI